MKYQELRVSQVAETLEKADTVIIPVGTIEAHGRHCPLGTDNIIPGGIVDLVEERAGSRVLIAPPIAYGHTFGMMGTPGSMDIPADVLIDFYFHVGKGFLDNGIKYILFLNGHGGNSACLSVASERLAELGATVLVNSWWVESARVAAELGGDKGHAGMDETSLVLAFRPDLVNMEEATEHFEGRAFTMYIKESARTLNPKLMSGNARAATAEHGKALAEAFAEDVVATLKRAWAGEFTVPRDLSY